MLRLLLILGACLVGPAAAMTTDEFDALKLTMQEHYEDGDYKVYLAPVVRLAFHDCVGGCDGCINLNHQDEPNKGLEGVIADLESLWDAVSSTYTDISRADFWQIAALGAIDAAIAKANNRKFDRDVPAFGVDSSNFKIGRADCATSPDTDVEHHFPEPTLSYHGLMSYYNDTNGFGFTAEEVTALMGAHTLGSMKKTASGYAGVWLQDETHVFDTNYYHVMLKGETVDGTACTWIDKNAATEKKPKWMHQCNDAAGAQVANMIHTDFEVFYDVKLDADTNMATCDVNPDASADEKCGPSEVHNLAATFLDNDVWFPAFSAVYLKMIEHGYEDGELSALS